MVIVFINIHHFGGAYCAGIMLLPTTSRIEEGAVKDYSNVPICQCEAFHHLGLEIESSNILLIKKL
jgi:hypothetical protein